MLRRKTLRTSVEQVVSSGRCSGCGGCTLTSKRVKMELSEDGYMRPSVTAHPSVSASEDRFESQHFERVCPGVGLEAPTRPEDSRINPFFGHHKKVWSAHATDPEVRFRGSSGGVLTAIQAWLLASGLVDQVVGTKMNPSDPKKSIPVTVTTPAQAVENAGSRYAPSATLSAVPRRITADAAIVCKPCEASALRSYLGGRNSPELSDPVVLSFFCAGVPSQNATNLLITQLGIDPSDVKSVRYRGNGWPGSFAVESENGSSAEMNYEESWGQHLGKTVQWRCKLCVDGTGADADISVGDYWQSDNNGYPVFDNADGNSVVIARTDRGLAIIEAMILEGTIQAEAIDLTSVESLQPLQTQRRRTLLARLLGRFAAGYRVPIYRGYGLTKLQLRASSEFPRAFVGTMTRSRQQNIVLRGSEVGSERARLEQSERPHEIVPRNSDQVEPRPKSG